MSSLGIINLDPVPIGKKFWIQVVPDVRVAVLINFLVCPEGLPVFFPEFGINQGIILSESTRAYRCILYLKVEAAQSN